MYARSWPRPYAVGEVGRPSFAAEHGLWTEEQTEAAARIEAGLDEVDLVRVAFCDPHGLARSKTLTAETFASVLRGGMDFSPGPFVFDTGHAVAVDFVDRPAIGVDEIIGAGDFIVLPDPTTFQVLPGREPRTAWVLGDEYLRAGLRHPLSARDVLRRVVDRYAEQGLAPVVGLEVEWYLTRLVGRTHGNVGNGFGFQGPAPEVEAVDSGYQFNLDGYSEAVSGVTGPMATMLLELGLPVRSIEHESGPGQVETTFNPLFAMDAADALVLFRTLVKQMCTAQGHHASFMSLPRLDGFDASGWHVHQSVMERATGRNVLAVEGTDDLSGDGKAYVEGQLARARELCLLSVPTVNGYRRLRSEFSLAPTRIGSSHEDRTAMVRVIGAGPATHLENRVAEPCANPYLAMAAQLSAGLEGLTRSLPEDSAPTSDVLPQSLRESLGAFRAGSAAVDLLGRPLATCFGLLKDSEVDRYETWCAAERPPDGEVTAWEQREYFENF